MFKQFPKPLAAALTAITLLAACVTEAPAERVTPVRSSADPIVIRNDDGGNVTGYILRRNELASSGRRVVFRGYCASACTMLITIPNACLAPDATVGFHAPHFIGSGKPAPMINQLMAQYYRNGILQKWNSTWSKSLKMQVISAKEYVRLDPQTKLCR